eukprot:CAMPEP_0185582388 /NCGR_PEP_ID=MMETSP0434-20130131/20604_1 /TAXON_ID=626734 ORGANISM="Favella taraikaensis, Strain Fe Narragansett Bay" /NCGR_SAMPLE_ID=MMETSP0434 /ASSEMBLY_ACC=CAM_ASM_000379 /LENGTH=136 /DNA_ID=CAMNT_0028201199 /DNA_START=158 /DNA_END=568 /DNA_ORIENTATION=-
MEKPQVPTYQIYSNGQDGKIDFTPMSERGQVGDKNWKCRTYWEMCTVFFQIISVFLYLAIFFIGKSIDDKDNYKDVTIYTQAINDWTTPLWASFFWSKGDQCEAGSFIDLGTNWLGTVEGNYTDGGVEPTNPENRG